MLRIGILSCLTLCVAIVISPGTATSATVTGSASLYANVFSGATTSTAGTGISVVSALSNATDSGIAGARITGTTTNNIGTMIWDRGAGNSSTVGTIIALQQVHPAGFVSPMPVEIRLDGNTIISDAGPNDGVMRYQAATLPAGTTGQTLELIFLTCRLIQDRSRQLLAISSNWLSFRIA